MSYTEDTIRLLIAHDSQDDAEQLINALRNAGKVTRAELALTEDDFVRALKSGAWELLLCRPSFGGISFEDALATEHRLGKSVPMMLLVDTMDGLAMREAYEKGVRFVAPADDRDLLSLILDRAMELVRLRKDLQHSQIALHEAERRLSILMDQSRDAIAYVVDGMHIHANDTYLEMFGYETADDLAGVPIMDMVSAENHEALKKLLRSRAQDESQTNELPCKGVTTDGKEFDATFIFSASNYDGEACTQIVIRAEGFDEEAMEEKLAEMRQTDPLTGLYNRGWFLEKMDQAVSDAVRSGQLYSVFMVRIDDFEQHQTSIGIDGSDELLATAAMTLEKFAGDEPLARISGEDFSILRKVSDLDEARDMAERIRDAFEHLMPAIKSKTVKVTASVGVAFVREDSHSSHAALTKAIECCNRASAENDGKGNAIHVHNPMDDVEAGSSEAIAMVLRTALEKNALSLKYQAIMAMEDDGKGFAEVFVSLPQPDGSTLSAAQFMPVAAERGLAGKIDRWVILNAVKAAAAYSDDVRILINLSGYSLEDSALSQWVGKALKAAKLDPSRVVFQFTEADLDSYLKQAGTFISAIHELGAKVSVSRFGGVPDPMKLFKHVPVDMVKFDGSYTEELDKKESKDAFSKLIASVSDSGKTVMVGFVESAAQMQSIWTLGGVDYLQGIYLQPPGDAITLGED
ncbi:MAG: EAL domain-containing protein [Alcanivoracaceae bacterium]